MNDLNIMGSVVKKNRGGALGERGKPGKAVETLRDSVDKTLRNYFANLDGQPVSDVYQLVLTEIEAPLLETVLDYTHGNQTKAAQVLGLNRGTLRKKLKQYGLL